MESPYPNPFTDDMKAFERFLDAYVKPNVNEWYRANRVPRQFFNRMGAAGWFGYHWAGNRMVCRPALRETLVLEHLAKRSPGLAVADLIASDLGMAALYLYGSQALQARHAPSAVRGDTLICIGNTENQAGSDAAGISMTAATVAGGWRLNGAKAYVTNGQISDLAVVTAVTDPAAERNRRISMFLVDLDRPGVRRVRLNKQVWIPSDLTRLDFSDVFVPREQLLGTRGHGLQQVLNVFTHSRIPISGLALGTASGALDLAIAHVRKRKAFGKPLTEFQAKAFELADLYARLESVRLTVYTAARLMDSGNDFRMASSVAKYLSVQLAQDVGTWSADLFGAASVIFEHPIHKFPMDAWAVSLAEGTQDVQKLVIFRELMRQWQESARSTPEKASHHQ